VRTLITPAVPWSEQTGDMTTRLSIGDFSRMTYLSVKSLRRYHDMGLLEPAHIDRYTGYRYYDASQVPLGQAIRRFRDLEMPLEQLKEVLHAPDASARNKLIIAHLEHMESALQQTQQTVASLRALLEQPHAPIAVEYRSVGAATAIAISEPVHRADLAAWWGEAFDELHRVLASSSAVRAGSDGALYPNEFFEEELGEVVAFIPVADMPIPSGRPQLIEMASSPVPLIAQLGAHPGTARRHRYQPRCRWADKMPRLSRRRRPPQPRTDRDRTSLAAIAPSGWRGPMMYRKSGLR